MNGGPFGIDIVFVDVSMSGEAQRGFGRSGSWASASDGDPLDEFPRNDADVCLQSAFVAPSVLAG
jgi:hypothetical protein